MGRPWSPPTHHQQIKKASGFGHTHTHTHARTNHTLTHVRAAPHYSCVVSSVMCSDSTGTADSDNCRPSIMLAMCVVFLVYTDSLEALQQQIQMHGIGAQPAHVQPLCAPHSFTHSSQ